jgi:Pyruvate/2-oxoacid:ferredoxin oxidoreductase delta subunit
MTRYMLRKIVRIDETRCDGCGQCITACAEGAIALVGGKAKLVSEVYCVGLGACLSDCPQDAISVEEREAAGFDEVAVQVHLQRLGRAPLPHAPQVAPRAAPQAHGGGCPGSAAREIRRPSLTVMRDAPGPAPAPAPRQGGSTLTHWPVQLTLVPPHAPPAPAPLAQAAPHAHGGGCPGSAAREIKRPSFNVVTDAPGPAPAPAPRLGGSTLTHWPVQLKLVPPGAPWLAGADLLLAADCVPFAYANFHADFLAGKKLLVGCPKLDDNQAYAAKLADLFARSDVASVTVIRMEVPCCGGISWAAREGLARSGKQLPMRDVVIGVDGAVRQA